MSKTTLLAASSDNSGLNPMSFTDQYNGVVLERLRYQRETGRFCDVAIHVAGKQFAAHRNVLASCSPYFDSILQSSKVTKERVVVSCNSPVAFELLINYIYSGRVVVDRSNVSDLLHLANNFLVTKLKNYCAEYLIRYLDAANCLSVKALAKRYNLPSLFKESCDYFDHNINRCLIDSVDILRYPMSQLVKIINDPKYQDVISPDVHLKLIIRWVGDDISAREVCFRQLLNAVPITQVNEATLEFVLDYSPLLTKSQSSRFILLKLMQDNGLSLEKYQPQLSTLAQQITGEELEGEYYEEEDDDDGDFDEEEDMENSPVEGHPTARQILDMTEYDENGAEKPRIRLKISIGKKDKNRMPRRSTGNVTKKRGRPPKEMPDNDVLPMQDDDEIDGVYATSSLTQHTITYTDEDFLDPEEVEPGEDNAVEGGTYQCGFCRFASTLDEDVEKHRARVHNANTIYVCQMCDYECCWSKQFYEHCREAHWSKSPYHCEQCPTGNFTRLPDLLAHRLHHTEERFFKCGHCGFKARTRTQLWAHEKMHNTLDERPFHCEECGRGFTQEDMILKHKNSHEEQRSFMCEDCGFASNNAEHLTTHRRQHYGDIFYCHFDNCDYSSPKKSQLAAHLRTHMAVRAHMCKICGRGFIEKSHLVRHERIHLEDKPFKCDICEYASSRRDKLKEHILKHHNGSANGVRTHRRRYKRARQLAVLNAQAKLQAPEAMFRPIPPSEAISQWADTQAAYQPPYSPPRAMQPGPSDPSTSYRAYSVTHPPVQHGGLSPGSMSLMNLPLGIGNEGQGQMNQMDISTPQLITPQPRSPQSHHDLFMDVGPNGMMSMAPGDPHRPMSLPNYGQQQQDPHHQMQQQPWGW